MDWISLIAVVGGSSVVSSVLTMIGNRQITRSQANNSAADYAEKIIAQSDKRVEQALADVERLRVEVNAQRKQKECLRGELEQAIARIHSLELALKDADMRDTEGRWYRCVRVCPDRDPPRATEAAQVLAPHGMSKKSILSQNHE